MKLDLLVLAGAQGVTIFVRSFGPRGGALNLHLFHFFSILREPFLGRISVGVGESEPEILRLVII